ncbi:tRNA (adenine(22)-N(1))-methyltransferase [Rubripirellula tenax]|uniref:tRNA (Adenine(22)-N(1))-methyltransferase n=1 Tax=Rubripirellula tenax TaxID=2528015 RepID=A0A5C6FG07_9BACT|nr:class I SAM-dependent methyltransferase [Rubripirellula tenax]TWU59745.1 tRNA (adenine(22)-N(1))-methyltransferase [Rubripirellula tenax]
MTETLPRLDQRLKAVASQIRCRVHADIGSDHAHLIRAMLAAGRIEYGIAIENKRQPFLNSQTTLAGCEAEVRFADGLDGLQSGEADGLSICGMGGRSVVGILSAHPDRVPPLVVIQPNRDVDRVRQWGIESGYHLVDETIAVGHWPYEILRFERADIDRDPAYDGLDREAALMFGPHMIRRWRTDFVERLKAELAYLEALDQLTDVAAKRRDVIERLLA